MLEKSTLEEYRTKFIVSGGNASNHFPSYLYKESGKTIDTYEVAKMAMYNGLLKVYEVYHNRSKTDMVFFIWVINGDDDNSDHLGMVILLDWSEVVFMQSSIVSKTPLKYFF